MIPKELQRPSVQQVAMELWPRVFELRRLAGMADDEQPVPPIRTVFARWSTGRWMPAANGTYLCRVDALGRGVLAVPERIDPFDASVPQAGWCLLPPPYRPDPGDVVEFLRSR